MPRPRRRRWVWNTPSVTYYKPAGIPKASLEEVVLTVDELEAIRLCDLENLSQQESAEKMNISQPTFNRILNSAKNKIADAIVNGKAIRIEGGVYEMAFGKGRGRGPYAAGPGGVCKCPNCGYEQPHAPGQPCTQLICPKCKTRMIRA